LKRCGLHKFEEGWHDICCMLLGTQGDRRAATGKYAKSFFGNLNLKFHLLF